MTRHSDDGRSISAACALRCSRPAIPSSPSTACQASRSPGTTSSIGSKRHRERPPARLRHSRSSRLAPVSDLALLRSGRSLSGGRAGARPPRGLLVGLGGRSRLRSGGCHRQAAAPTEAWAWRQRLLKPGHPCHRRRHWQRRLVRVRAQETAAGEGARRDHHARLWRVRGLRLDDGFDTAHRPQRQHRDLPALADRHRHPMSGPVPHRALRRLGGQRDQRRPRLPAFESASSSAADWQDELLRLLVRWDRHREHDEPATATSGCRNHERSSSTTRTTEGSLSSASTSLRSTTRWPEFRRRRSSSATRAPTACSRIRGWSAAPATPSFRSSARSRRRTRTSC